jgi:hypothetical protein
MRARILAKSSGPTDPQNIKRVLQKKFKHS